MSEEKERTLNPFASEQVMDFYNDFTLRLYALKAVGGLLANIDKGFECFSGEGMEAGEHRDGLKTLMDLLFESYTRAFDDIRNQVLNSPEFLIGGIKKEVLSESNPLHLNRSFDVGKALTILSQIEAAFPGQYPEVPVLIDRLEGVRNMNYPSAEGR